MTTCTKYPIRSNALWEGHDIFSGVFCSWGSDLMWAFWSMWALLKISWEMLKNTENQVFCVYQPKYGLKKRMFELLIKCSFNTPLHSPHIQIQTKTCCGTPFFLYIHMQHVNQNNCMLKTKTSCRRQITEPPGIIMLWNQLFINRNLKLQKHDVAPNLHIQGMLFYSLK